MALGHQTHLGWRLRIAAGGVVVSVALIGAFFALAWMVNDSPSYAWIGRSLLKLFMVLNPLLGLIQWASARISPSLIESPVGQVALKVVFFGTFLGWWWLVAVVADRLRGKPVGAGAA